MGGKRTYRGEQYAVGKPQITGSQRASQSIWIRDNKALMGESIQASKEIRI